MSRGPQLAPVLRATAIGLTGAGAATAAGLPAGALIGASLLVSAAAWAGLRLAFPVALRNFGFLGIGLSLGSGVDVHLLDDLGAWAASLTILALSLVATLAVGAALLHRVAGLPVQTAILGASPGTMSYAIAIAQEKDADVTAVLVVQSMRLLLLAAILPLAVQGLGIGTPAALPAVPGMAALPLALLALAAAALGAGLDRLGLPAAWLIGGFAASGIAHWAGWAVGTLPGWAAFAAFAITGTVIGTRFSGIAPRDLWRNLLATALAGAATAGMSLLFALAARALTGLPFGQLWVAFAPGGVEAMAAIGLALGHDPAFIAVHHLARIVMLIVLVPVALNLRVSRPG